MNIEVYGVESRVLESGRDHPLHDEPRQPKVVKEGEVGPKFPLTVVALVPYEHRFETKEEFDEYMQNDLLNMGYAELDEDDNNKVIWNDADKLAWEENYEGVPFPPKTVQDYVAYTKIDLDENRYGFDELDFEQADSDQYQWFIREEKAE